MSASRGDRPQKNPTLTTPLSQTPILQRCEKIIFWFSCRPVCGPLLWQPEQTNTTFGRESSQYMLAITIKEAETR